MITYEKYSFYDNGNNNFLVIQNIVDYTILHYIAQDDTEVYFRGG